jgi:hypothetical protein
LLKFEDENMQESYMCSDQMGDALAESSGSVKFFYLASRNSEAFARFFEAFHVISHVICMAEVENAYEPFIDGFQKRFYENIFENELPVCAAFKKTKRQLSLIDFDKTEEEDRATKTLASIKLLIRVEDKLKESDCIAEGG